MSTRALLVLPLLHTLLAVACNGDDAVPEDPAATVSLDGGTLSLELAHTPRVVLAGVTFRAKIKDRWIGPADFGAPGLSRSGQQYTVTYPAGPSGGPQQLVMLVRMPSQSGDAVSVRVSLSAPSTASFQLSAFELVVPPGGVKLPGLGGELLFFNNGYQSWSFTGVLRLAAPFASPAASSEPSVFRAGDGDPTYEKPGVGWWFGLLAPGKDGPCLVAGAATAHHRRTVVLPSLPSAGKAGLTLRTGTAGELVTVSAGATAQLDEMVLAAAVKPLDALEAYTTEVARQARPLRAAKVTDPTGWWSWNIFFHKVTEEQVLDHAELLQQQLKPHGFGLVELDDGYQQRWGDWESTDSQRFPSGLDGLAKKITQRGLKAGLWLAPFLVDERSTLVKDHPEWFVRKADKTPLTHQQLGVSDKMWVLDPTHPGAAKHLQDLFGRLVKAGYSLFKLDFLYAGALAGLRHEPGTTGIEALGLGLELIRKAAPEPVHINLCGMPLLPAVGRGHSLRFGSDIVFEQLQPSFTLVAHEARNVMLRGFFDSLIRNDPDQALVRSPLSPGEARVAATLTAMTGFHSAGDDLTKLPADRLAMLTHPDLLAIARLARSARAVDMLATDSGKLIQSPVLDTGLMLNDPRTVPPSRFLLAGPGGAAYLALFNWTATKRETTVDLAALGHGGARVRELWSKKQLTPSGDKLKLTIEKHSVALLKLQK